MATARPAFSPNRLLNSLPPGDYKALLPHLEPVDLPFRKVLYASKARVEHIYFPSRGVISTVAAMKNRQIIEIGICGLEGAVGSTTASWDAPSPYEVQVQVAGHGVRIKIEAFRKFTRPGSSFQQILSRYQAASLFQTCQSVACNGLHSVGERCCRWLLMTQDRMQDDAFGLTHEFLGVMLGVRRASVSEVLSPLQTKGLIKYSRGVMTVRNRPRLEKAACECYQFARSDFDRLLP